MQSPLISLIMKRFGFVPGMPKPKTDLDWARIFNKHKIEVPSVKKLSLTLSSKGPGQTGARHFKAYGIPPIQKWNPNVEIEVKHDFEKPIDPVLAIEFVTGEKHIMPIKGIHADQIKTKLVGLDATRRPETQPNIAPL